MTVYLVRHAKAGSRRNWSGDDALRPLSRPGRRQVSDLTTALGHLGVTRIVSSPYTRCVQTVEPLAGAIGLTVDVSDALSEGAPATEAVALFEKLARENAVLCSHGDVLGELLMWFADHGLRLDDFRLEKGSVWVVECEHGRAVSAQYVSPVA
ncbi:MAG: SixA phosphatase family protein [Acidimicrobiia bacterium]